MNWALAVRTILLCKYLHSEELRREIQEGLNVVEQWNGANGFIFYGKNSEIATNRLDEQELSVLALHLLQICLVYINTLMIQRVLTESVWEQRMTLIGFAGIDSVDLGAYQSLWHIPFGYEQTTAT